MKSNKSGMKVKSKVKAGGLMTNNHTGSGMKVKSKVKAGGLMTANHSGTALRA